MIDQKRVVALDTPDGLVATHAGQAEVGFSLALPLITLFVLGGVFGNDISQPGGKVVFRGVGAMNYYVPACPGSSSPLSLL